MCPFVRYMGVASYLGYAARRIYWRTGRLRGVNAKMKVEERAVMWALKGLTG